MKLTASQIEGYVYDRLKDGTLAGLIGGTVYREGYRPRNSTNEDAVVVFTAGTTDQVETGEVTVKIYVPDIDPFQNGCLVKDGQRVAQIETGASSWIEELNTNSGGFYFQLTDTIRTMPDDKNGQHRVTVHLKYKYFTN